MGQRVSMASVRHWQKWIECHAQAAMFEVGVRGLCHAAGVSADPAAAPSGVVTFLFTDIEGRPVGGRLTRMACGRRWPPMTRCCAPRSRRMTGSCSATRRRFRGGLRVADVCRERCDRRATELQLPVRMGLGDFAAHDLGLWQFIAGPPFLADVEVVESVAVAGVPQLTAPLADRDPRPPRRPPVRTVIGAGGAPGSHSSNRTG